MINLIFQIDFSTATTSLTSAANQLLGVFSGLVGAYAVGRAAIMFIRGERDAPMSIVVAIIAYALAQIAQGLL